MRILDKTTIDFLGLRRVTLIISLTLIAIGLVSLVAKGGPRLGIDFSGGSQVIARFADAPEVETVRDALTAHGLGDATIQEFEQASNEIIIRTPGVAEGEEIDEAVSAVRAALDSLVGAQGAGDLDLNNAGHDEFQSRLLQVNPLGFDLDGGLEDAQGSYRAEIDKLLAVKSRLGLFTDWSQLDAANVDPAVLQVLRDAGRLGGYTIVGSESVGPQVGRDLRRQAMQAIVWALLGMLGYITYRFEFKFGVGAVAALAHDVMIVLGAFSLTNREFNLPVIAAFMTIVGYSLNDTVVVFDRIRENTTVLRRMSLKERMNTSLNQTLSRTLLTSSTTLLVVLCLFLFGGPVINDFSFALLIGVLVGTYSSLFVATPIIFEWQRRDLEKKRAR